MLDLKTIQLDIGDRVDFSVGDIFDSRAGKYWAWTGEFVRDIAPGEVLKPEEVVRYYGRPEAHYGGFYTPSYERMYNEAVERGASQDRLEAIRDKDVARMLRMYEGWKSVKVRRLIFRKDNGSYVMLPAGWRNSSMRMSKLVQKWVQL